MRTHDVLAACVLLSEVLGVGMTGEFVKLELPGNCTVSDDVPNMIWLDAVIVAFAPTAVL